MTFRVGILALTVLLGGCATQQRQKDAKSLSASPSQQLGDERGVATSQNAWDPADGAPQQVASAALIFEPNFGPYARPVELPRAPRRQSAFVGWQDLTATYFMVRTDDRQGTDDWTNGLQRRAIIERVGVSYR